MPYFTDLGGPMPKLVRDFMSEPTKGFSNGRYVDRFLLRDKLCQEDAITIGGIATLNNFPAADVAPVKHGRWLPVDDNMDAFDCSECDAMVSKRMNYCPNCGARMDKELNNV